MSNFATIKIGVGSVANCRRGPVLTALPNFNLSENV